MDDEELQVIHLDLSGLKRETLEAIANEALTVLTLGEITAIFAAYGVDLVPTHERKVN